MRRRLPGRQIQVFGEMRKAAQGSERGYVLQWAIAAVFVSSIVYGWGWLITPSEFQFLGLTHNIDDGAVYLSWMRQAADGHFFIRNLFTNQAQAGGQFNVLFLLMGNCARLLHLPLITAFHLFRCASAIVLVWSVWRFSKLFLDDSYSRRLLIPILCFSSGVGWLLGGKPPTGPVDVWQPEAITFLSVYLNPLFLAGLILMVWSLYHLTLAERNGRVSNAVWAGVCLLLLGNVHTYDVVTVACVWVCHLVVLAIVRRAVPVRGLVLSVIVGFIAVPSVAYQFYVYSIDLVLHARANSPALSPPVWSYFAGYGLVLVGAAAGAVLSIMRHKVRQADHRLASDKRLLLIVWSVVGFVLPYVPVAQQRKLVMGLHIPLCILCAYALSRLLSGRPKWIMGAAAAVFVGFTAVGNMAFLSSDEALLSKGRTATHYFAYMPSEELDAMRYLRENAEREDTVFAPPTFALFTPAFTGCRVYYGHWSETPDHERKFAEWSRFVRHGADDKSKERIFKSTGSEFYVSTGPGTGPPESAVGAYLQRVYESGEVAVYRRSGEVGGFGQ